MGRFVVVLWFIAVIITRTIDCYRCWSMPGRETKSIYKDVTWSDGTTSSCYMGFKEVECSLCGGTGVRSFSFRPSDARVSRDRQRDIALSNPGVAVPGTGKRNGHHRSRKMRPYERPHVGGRDASLG